MKAFSAAVFQSERPRKRHPVPLLEDYNHAIVYVRHVERDYWIDPTAQVSFAQGIHEGIAGKEALILEPDNPRLIGIPLGTPDGSVEETTAEYTVRESGNAEVSVKGILKGWASLFLTGAQLFHSKEEIDYLVLSAAADGKRLMSGEVGKYNLETRSVKDIDIDAKLTLRGVTMHTTAGQAFRIERKFTDFLKITPDGAVADVFIGFPHKKVEITKLRKIDPVGDLPGKCTVETPWMVASREYSRKDGDIIVYEKTERKVPVIANKDVNSEKFSAFQAEIERCFGEFAIVFKWRNAPLSH